MSTEATAARLSHVFRDLARADLRPLGDLVDLVASTLGIDVMVIAAEQSEHGLTMRDPRTTTTVIAVAVTEHPMRQRSSILHEVGHVLASDVDRPTEVVPGTRTTAEKQADAFARHALLPLDAARDAVQRQGGFADLPLMSGLVRDFGLSPQMAAIQLRTIGSIDQETYAQWSTLSAGKLAWQFGWRDKYQALVAASNTTRAPQRLLARAIVAHRAGVLGLPEIAAWYGTPVDDLSRELGVPAQGPPTAEAPDDEFLPPGWAHG